MDLYITEDVSIVFKKFLQYTRANLTKGYPSYLDRFHMYSVNTTPNLSPS